MSHVISLRIIPPKTRFIGAQRLFVALFHLFSALSSPFWLELTWAKLTWVDLSWSELSWVSKTESVSEWVSQWVSDKGRQRSDLGPIKRNIFLLFSPKNRYFLQLMTQFSHFYCGYHSYNRAQECRNKCLWVYQITHPTLPTSDSSLIVTRMPISSAAVLYAHGGGVIAGRADQFFGFCRCSHHVWWCWWWWCSHHYYCSKTTLLKDNAKKAY